MKPLILVTNDDGVRSPGLWAVVEALMDLGELLIVAPMNQQTGMGRSFPKNEQTGIIEEVMLQVNGQKLTAYGVYGSPAQAVSHGVLELAKRPIDLCVSGINYGENLGRSLTCSGTLGAAFEADSHGIPAVAISRKADLSIQHANDFLPMDWSIAKSTTSKIVGKLLNEGYPDGVHIMNVNVPEGATATTEIRTTRLSSYNHSVFIKPPARDLSERFIMTSEMEADIELSEKDSDVYAFSVDRVISITPLTWDFTAQVGWQFKEEA